MRIRTAGHYGLGVHELRDERTAYLYAQFRLLWELGELLFWGKPGRKVATPAGLVDWNEQWARTGPNFDIVFATVWIWVGIWGMEYG